MEPEAELTAAARARVVAFYLPQFHLTPENDAFWGPGYSEWTAVAAARPRYPGHALPDLPGELGFYDLRVPETRAAQAALAREHGIAAFCYWHYWFGGGRRALQRPFQEVLDSGEPDFPFCLAWANHAWENKDRRGPDRLLIAQTYPGSEDEKAHFAAVEAAFHDPRYLRVDGRPLFLVYEPTWLPDPRRFRAHWEELALASGLPGLFLVGRSTSGALRPSEIGFDAVQTGSHLPLETRFADRRKRLLTPDWWLSAASRRLGPAVGVPGIFPFRRWAPSIPFLAPHGELSFPMAMANWDSTPRWGARGSVLHGATPELFEDELRRAIDLVMDRPPEHRLVFVKSWNEWAEGNHLEPCRRFGRGWLEAVARAVRDD